MSKDATAEYGLPDRSATRISDDTFPDKSGLPGKDYLHREERPDDLVLSFDLGRKGGGESGWDRLRKDPESVDPEFRHLLKGFLKDYYGLSTSPKDVLKKIEEIRDQILNLESPAAEARIRLKKEGRGLNIGDFLTERLSVLVEKERELSSKGKRLYYGESLAKRILESERGLSLVERVLDPAKITLISDKEAEAFLNSLRGELATGAKRRRKTHRLKTVGGAELFFGSTETEFLKEIAGKTVPEFKEFLVGVQEKKRQEYLEDIFWNCLAEDYQEWWNLKEPERAGKVSTQVPVKAKERKPKTLAEPKAAVIPVMTEGQTVPKAEEPAKRKVGEVLLTLPPDIVFEPRIPEPKEKLAGEEKEKLERWLAVWCGGVKEIRINPDGEGNKIARVFLRGDENFAWLDFSLLCKAFVWPADSGFKPDMKPEELKAWWIPRRDKICFPDMNNPGAIIKVVFLPEKPLAVPVAQFVKPKEKVPVTS